MLGLREDLLGEIAELKGLQRGTLRLGLPRGQRYAFRADLRAVSRSLSRHRDRPARGGQRAVGDLLHSGELDLAGLLLPVSEDFETQDLAREPLVALLKEDHALAGGTHRAGGSGRNAAGAVRQGFRAARHGDPGFRARHLDPHIAVRTSQIGFMMELVAGGVGVAFLPRMIALSHVRAGVALVSLADPSLEWHMALAWRRGAYLCHAARHGCMWLAPAGWPAMDKEAISAGGRTSLRASPAR
jgi:DNA-binding transcriptional LysR family regulator